MIEFKGRYRDWVETGFPSQFTRRLGWFVGPLFERRWSRRMLGATGATGSDCTLLLFHPGSVPNLLYGLFLFYPLFFRSPDLSFYCTSPSLTLCKLLSFSNRLLMMPVSRYDASRCSLFFLCWIQYLVQIYVYGSFLLYKFH